MRATVQALIEFWREKASELGRVSKPTFDALDELIRQDEREKCIAKIERAAGDRHLSQLVAHEVIAIIHSGKPR